MTKLIVFIVFSTPLTIFANFDMFLVENFIQKAEIKKAMANVSNTLSVEENSKKFRENKRVIIAPSLIDEIKLLHGILNQEEPISSQAKTLTKHFKENGDRTDLTSMQLETLFYTLIKEHQKREAIRSIESKQIGLLYIRPQSETNRDIGENFSYRGITGKNESVGTIDSRRRTPPKSILEFQKSFLSQEEKVNVNILR